jgi:Fe2+ or Zn2+ uptake regulation protein
MNTEKLLFEQTDQKFREYLRNAGLGSTHHRAAVLQAFLQNPKPVTAEELLYQVKKGNFSVSFHCVYKTLKLLIRSGLAFEILSEDRSARRYTHELAVAQCSHQHLVCKDCGAVVEEQS